MAYINVSGTGNFATLVVSTATITSSTGTGVLKVPSLQNITLSNANGTYRWKQLDTTSELAISIAATNQVSMNVVVDDTSFFGTTSTNAVTAVQQGLFKLSNDKVLVKFRLYFNGTDAGDKYVDGEGYFTGLAPTVSADQPVWVSPLAIDVVGEFSSPGTV